VAVTVSTSAQVDDLRAHARAVRRASLGMVHRAGVGHPGGDLSAADILVALYFAILAVDPARPALSGRDRLIMSKGHASAVLYATLAEAGFFDAALLRTYMQPSSPLSGHPRNGAVPGVEASTGPLGHGLPIGVGAALAAKLDHAPWRVFVLTGDGELQEGSNWESAMIAAHHRLDNLVLIIDRNRLQQGDQTERTSGLEPLADKWRAFGWAVRETDGHDFTALCEVLGDVPFQPGHPSCVIAHTHKGQGVSFMRDQVGWHHRVPTDPELALALQELGEPLP
jgi:transketolase